MATEARRWELRLGKLWPLLELEEQRQKFASQNTSLTRYSKQKGFWVKYVWEMLWTLRPFQRNCKDVSVSTFKQLSSPVAKAAYLTLFNPAFPKLI